MGGLRQRRVLSSVTLKRRKSWLLALDAFGSVTCTATTGTGNTYPAGISYNRILPGDLTVNLANDVTVNLQTVGTAVSVTNAVGGNVFVNDAGATITAVSPGNANNGIHAQSVTGNVIVTSSGIITLGNSVGGENAIFAGTGGGTASVTYTGPSSGPGLIAGGQESSGIQALNFGNGDAIITASGNVAVSGPNVYGLIAHAGFQLAGAGDASVTFHSGTINASGVAPRGILAWVDGNGSATVTTDAGTFINITGGSPGVLLYTDTATAANGQKLVANIESTITGVGRRARGIEADSNADAPIFVTYTGPGITTAGERANGINGLSRSGSVNVISTGPITTNGFRAYGILADSGTILSSTTFNGAPPGGEPTVVTPSVSGPGGSIVVTTSGQGSITTQGVESHGIWATSTTGTVQVTTTNVSTTGEFSAGINAAGGGGTTVNVAQGASVKGGWQSDVTGVGPTDGLPAAGVILNSSGGTATLNNFGSIGALSDRAVAGDPVVINNGIITGFVQFTGGGNSIENNGLFDLRHFAQTTPNGGRDTLRVAIADLGEGPGNTFNNTGTGTLRLAAVTGATTLDNTGEYLPLNNPNNSMLAPGGPLQGHLVGVASFTNSGTIDLQSNPVAGDVLVITRARQAGTAPTFPIAGAAGTAFISNGGRLLLDTVLNQGGAATRSDTLVVDGTSVGPGGATSMAIRNAGGGGALTVGDGILVTQVLDGTSSAPGAFSLQGGSITAGAFDYFLFKGGGSLGSQGNWYLRSTLIAPTTPDVPPPEPAPGTPPLPTLAPGAAPIPLFQPGVAVMSVMPSVARTLGLLTLGTFNERQGDQLLVRGGCSRETQDRLWNAGKSITGDENCTTRFGAWGRVFGQNTREHFAQGARPDFDGSFAGFQVGADLWRLESSNGHRDNIGFYVAQARASGSVHGSVDGFEGALAGHVDLDASSYGGYWTHLGPSNWYIDTVVQGTHFFGTPQSIRGVSTTVNGDAFTGSIEAGYPIQLAPWLSFEPQIQGIWQRVWLYDTLVPVSTISFDRADVFTGRAGALLRGTFGSTGGVWQPYLKGNVWWGSNGFDTVTFNGFGIPTGRNGGTTLEGGGGVAGKLTRNLSVYGDASYLTSVSGESHIALKGNVGLRVTW